MRTLKMWWSEEDKRIRHRFFVGLMAVTAILGFILFMVTEPTFEGVVAGLLIILAFVGGLYGRDKLGEV